MKSFSASLVYTLTGPPLPNGTVTVDGEGYVTSVAPASRETGNLAETLHFNGIILPGFVNAHCHLELSHLKGKIGQKKGIADFIGAINRYRTAADDQIGESARLADQEMIREGIVATGDISNTADTLEIKKKSPIAYYTFVETFGFHPSRAVRAFENAVSVWSLFHEQGLPASIVPHSPYSVSDELFQKFVSPDNEKSGILTIHNQESQAENQFFQDGKGPILDHLTGNLGLDASHFRPPGKSPLRSVIPLLPSSTPLLLVHNTFTSGDDLNFLAGARKKENTWLVLCPNSNLYIENQLPPVRLFRIATIPICLGTDSLASNTCLSVLSELKTLHFAFPEIPLEELFAWACRNGAGALGMENRLGTLEAGKKPGVLLITPADIENRRLTPESAVVRLA